MRKIDDISSKPKVLPGNAVAVPLLKTVMQYQYQ
jgi:hypothetical protein